MKKELFQARLSAEEKAILTSYARRKKMDASELFREWVRSLQEEGDRRESLIETR